VSAFERKVRDKIHVEEDILCFVSDRHINKCVRGFLVNFLVLSVASEFVLLRVLMRMGYGFPKEALAKSIL